MIDLSKVRVGDQVTFCGEVVDKEECGTQIKVAFCKPPRMWCWIPAAEIIKYKPRQLQVGDIVTWGAADVNYEIVAIKGNKAILYHCTFRPQIKFLSDLTRVETSDET